MSLTLPGFLRHPLLAAGLLLFVLFLICQTVFSRWIGALLRAAQPDLYLSLFFLLLFVLLAAARNRITSMRFVWAVVAGALTGQLLGLVVLVGHQLVTADGRSGTLHALENPGIAVFVGMNLLGAFALGSWLFGGIAFGALQRLSQRTSAETRSRA